MEQIDLAEPACVILPGILHFAEAGTARDAAAAFAWAVVPAASPPVVSCSESTARSTSSKLRPVVIGYTGTSLMFCPGRSRTRSVPGDEVSTALEVPAAAGAGRCFRSDGT